MGAGASPVHPLSAASSLPAQYRFRRWRRFICAVRTFALAGFTWFANQAIGYGMLNFPRTRDSFAWGAAIGVTVLAATAIAIAVDAFIRASGWIVTALAAFAAAFVAYETTLFASTALRPTGPEAFGLPVVLYILPINALAFVGLAVLQGIGTTAGLPAPRAVSAPGTAR
jgi:hypothetical protein